MYNLNNKTMNKGTSSTIGNTTDIEEELNISIKGADKVDDHVKSNDAELVLNGYVASGNIKSNNDNIHNDEMNDKEVVSDNLKPREIKYDYKEMIDIMSFTSRICWRDNTYSMNLLSTTKIFNISL